MLWWPLVPCGGRGARCGAELTACPRRWATLAAAPTRASRRRGPRSRRGPRLQAFLHFIPIGPASEAARAPVTGNFSACSAMPITESVDIVVAVIPLAAWPRGPAAAASAAAPTVAAVAAATSTTAMTSVTTASVAAAAAAPSSTSARIAVPAALPPAAVVTAAAAAEEVDEIIDPNCAWHGGQAADRQAATAGRLLG